MFGYKSNNRHMTKFHVNVKIICAHGNQTSFVVSEKGGQNQSRFPILVPASG